MAQKKSGLVQGIWKGIVEDTTDPNNLGRMKIRVAELHGTQTNIPTEDIPWCSVCLPAHSFAIPVVGDGVWVMFEQGDIHFPVYMGTLKFLSMGITPKGALPSSQPLEYQAPGNSPPPPLAPDIAIINAQRQAVASVISADINLIPYPPGYGLDQVGQLQTQVNTALQTEITNATAALNSAIAAPDALLNAALLSLQTQVTTTIAKATAAVAIPQIFTSAVTQSLASLQSLQANVNALAGQSVATIRAGLATAQSTVTAVQGYAAGLVQNLSQLMATAVAQLQSQVMNFETYFEMPGIQVPAVALMKQSPDPVVRVLIQSPSGHTVAANDDPGNEFLRIIDRVGQILNFDGAVSTAYNLNNQSQRTGDAYHGGAVPIASLVNQRATITLMDLLGQFLQLDANQPAGVNQAKVILQGLNAQALIIDSTDGANKVTLQDAAGSFLVLDSTTGDEHTTLEDSSGANILMTADGIVITDGLGNVITMGANGISITDLGGNVISTTSGGIQITAAAVKGGGTGAVKHLVYLEDLITIFNTHTHPSSGAPPLPAHFLKLINGTQIMVAE